MVQEIDADSVQLVDGLVHFKYRERYSNGGQYIFEKPIEGLADCAGRRYADVTRGTPELHSIYEKTQSAYKLDFACRLAGLGTRKYVSAAQPTPYAWAPYAKGSAIDSNTIEVKDGLVYFRYLAAGGYTSETSPAVVDCAHRQRSEGTPERHNLQPITEGSPQAWQAELACKLASQSMPAGPGPVPVDFSVRIPAADVGSDNIVYDIDPSSVTLRDGLVRFVYFTRYLTDGTVTILNQRIPAVVDCAARQRSDDVAGKFDLKPVEPDTRGANQVERVCKMADRLASASR